jgi:hypothetical protein
MEERVAKIEAVRPRGQGLPKRLPRAAVRLAVKLVPVPVLPVSPSDERALPVPTIDIPLRTNTRGLENLRLIYGKQNLTDAGRGFIAGLPTADTASSINRERH